MVDIAFGLILLVVGAEALVRGASRLAVAAGVPPLIIGLTVVAFGTSAPELAVSVVSSMHGQADIALGNVVGSNIFNVLFILGVSAIILPLSVSAHLIRMDVPVMIGASVAVVLMALDGRIGPVDGTLLTGTALLYTLLLIRAGRAEVAAGTDGQAGERRSRARVIADLIQIGIGLGLLVFGSQMLVNGSVAVARAFGVSEMMIGLTIVAAGTSLPELATSVIAAVRGERDIAVGNIVGSNIFNILGILGVSGLVADGGVLVSHAAITFDIPVMVAVAIACLPIFLSGTRISRAEGVLFVLYYAAYVAYITLDARQHEALPAFSRAMMLFVVPLTALGIVLSVARRWLRRSSE